MLHLFSGLYTEWTRKVPFNILVLGPEGVGKSCLIEGVKTSYDKKPGLPMEKVRPTVGQNIYEMPMKADLLRFWDLGGSADMRRIWNKYYKDCHALLWVIDAKWLDDEVDEVEKVPQSQVQDEEERDAGESVRGRLERTSSSLAQRRQKANTAWDLLSKCDASRQIGRVHISYAPTSFSQGLSWKTRRWHQCRY
jgi:ADP-ribosylation factor related protein 1